jgi:hypothetical protein
MGTTMMIRSIRPVRENRQGTRLTVSDRVALFTWEAELPTGLVGRVSLHEDVPCQDEEHVAFVLVARADKGWADWGLARCGRGIMLWSCADGVQLGLFHGMDEALARLTELLGGIAPAAPRPACRIIPFPGGGGNSLNQATA